MDSQGGSLGKTRRSQDKIAYRTLWQPQCFSHPCSCCTQGVAYMKYEMMNILPSVGPNLKLQSKTNSRQHSLTEELLSSLLFIVNAENPPVVQSTSTYIYEKRKKVAYRPCLPVISGLQDKQNLQKIYMTISEITLVFSNIVIIYCFYSWLHITFSKPWKQQ